jgi:hypothetical protein
MWNDTGGAGGGDGESEAHTRVDGRHRQDRLSPRRRPRCPVAAGAISGKPTRPRCVSQRPANPFWRQGYGQPAAIEGDAHMRIHGVPIPEQGFSDGCRWLQPPRSVFRPNRQTAPIATVAGARAPRRRRDDSAPCRRASAAGTGTGDRQFFATAARSARKISTRRFCARPSAVALVATGSRSPRPSIMIRPGFTPRAAR